MADGGGVDDSSLGDSAADSEGVAEGVSSVEEQADSTSAASRPPSPRAAAGGRGTSYAARCEMRRHGHSLVRAQQTARFLPASHSASPK